MKKFILALTVAMAAVCFIGCGNNEFREIPAGYVGKILTPSGWQEGILEAGQVDIKIKNIDGSYNTLVILEATSVAIKESFGQSGEDNGSEDHRIIISKTPVTADVYIRVMCPTDANKRNAIFAQITPQAVQGQDRVSIITIQRIYEQFAKMDARSGVRAVFQGQSDVYYITSHLDSVNSLLGQSVINMFNKSGVPLEVQNVVCSNVKPDASIWEAENQKQAALAQVEAITKIGAAIRANPEYVVFKKYDTYKEIASKIGTFTVIEGNPNGIVVR